MRSSTRCISASLLVAVFATGCAASRQPPAVGDPSPSPAALARADSGRPPYTPADVKFMQGMIAHHAQAVYMASLTTSHRARGDVRILAERIDVAQRDEIAFMQRWLGERREAVPEATFTHDMSGHAMPGMSGALMPGMLTHEQLMQLDEATGPAFDRLFLTFMIQHHQGALTMVEQLFANRGAGQDITIFRFASDVTADQTTEIDRMRTMLPPATSQREQ